MSNRRPPARSAGNDHTGAIVAVVVAVAAVIVVAGLIAIVATRGSDGDTTSGTEVPPTTVDGSAQPGATAEVQPVTVAGAVLAELEDPDADPAVGQPAPTLIGATFDGSAVSVTPGQGAYMVVFLAHWCPHCNNEIPRLLEWKANGDVPEGLQVVGVSTAVAADRPDYPPSKWTVDKGWSWPMMADSAQYDAFFAYGGSGFPFVAVVGDDGLVKARWSGESSVDEINSRVRAALGL